MNELPWSFEAFRKFITYEALQQATAVLLSFEGLPLFKDLSLMQEFERKLFKRSGLEWSPVRNVSEGINFNIEGDLFRNKARVFSSFYLIHPISFENKDQLVITDFAKGLGSGRIEKKDFYEEVFLRFEYPHPAYKDNWKLWNLEKIRIKPLLFFLAILIDLYEKTGNGAISAGELAEFAHPNPFPDKVSDVVNNIIESRTTKKNVIGRVRSDKVDRKINDILGYMCISEYCFYDGPLVRLNLVDKHNEEKSLFWNKRLNQDRLGYLKRLASHLQYSADI